MADCFETFRANGIFALRVPFLEDTGIAKAVFSTRIGGVSPAPCDTMNLSFTHEPGDAGRARVIENYHRFADACTLSRRFVLSRQVHGLFVHEAAAEDEAAFGKRGASPEADALITDRPGVVLVKGFADCVPIYLLDPVHRAIGLIHSGWRGTVARIGAHTLKRMAERYHTDPADALCAIGPAMGPCHFEVDMPVAERFLDEFANPALIARRRGEKAYVDLWAANRQTLTDAGVNPRHIVQSRYCTFCRDEWFFSHRRTGSARGGMAAMLMLN